MTLILFAWLIVQLAQHFAFMIDVAFAFTLYRQYRKSYYRRDWSYWHTLKYVRSL